MGTRPSSTSTNPEAPLGGPGVRLGAALRSPPSHCSAFVLAQCKHGANKRGAEQEAFECYLQRTEVDAGPGWAAQWVRAPPAPPPQGCRFIFQSGHTQESTNE